MNTHISFYQENYPILYSKGRQIDGVWHTSVVVYGREHSYNCLGITINPPVSDTS